MTIHLMRDLETLHHNLLSMCAIVEEMIHQAVETLSEPSYEKAQALNELDDEIDSCDVRINESCLKILAL